MWHTRLAAFLESSPRRGALAGALGGLVLTSMFLQAHGASLDRYDLHRGNKLLGYLIVWVLAIGIGALFGWLGGARAAADLGFSLSRGLLVGLAWFVAASCIILPPLRGVRPFSLDPAVAGEAVQYLVYGLLLGTGFHQLPELLASPERERAP